MSIQVKRVSKVLLSPLFEALSQEFRYEVKEYLDDVDGLMTLWSDNGAVEIYRDKAERTYGRAKPSDEGAESGTIPYLMGLYHVRLLGNGDNDPLVIIDFQPVEGTDDTVTLRFIIDHDQMFGKVIDKRFPDRLKEIKKRVDEAITRSKP